MTNPAASPPPPAAGTPKADPGAGGHAARVPAATLGFWVLKILATTLGETGGDTLSMSAGLGYLESSALFLLLFAALTAATLAAPRFHPVLYWATIIASTLFGTTLADFADRSLGIGYVGGSALLATLLLLVLGLGAWRTGSLAPARITSRGAEVFYWLAITFAQTLGTALGDAAADTAGLGFGPAALLFGALLALTALAWASGRLGGAAAFWTAFVLTRPLGATLGDLLDKAPAEGGFGLSRAAASLVLLALFALLLALRPSRPAEAAATA